MQVSERWKHGVLPPFLTFFIAITLLSITQGFVIIMFQNSNLFMHTINPLCITVLFVVILADARIKFKTSFLAMIPITAYAFLFFYRIVLNILNGSSDGSNTLSTAPQALSQPLRNSTLNCATGALSTAPQAQAMLLSALLFSFGHVLLAGMAPDHFILSMMMLLLLLLVSLEKLQQQRPFTIAEALIFFIIIAGITLSNGVKVFICVLLVNWLALSPKRNNGRGRGVGLVFLSLLFASALLWGIARAEYHYLVLPQEKIAHAKKAADKKRKQEAAARRKAEAEKTFQMLIDQAQATGDTSLFAQATHRLDSVRTAKPKVRRNPYGKPIAKGEFMRWTDITTSRWSSAVENLFGEGIQLHRDYALGDVLRHRPVIVNYRSPVQYIIEAFILLLFLAGVWFGRRSHFLWIALACAAFDMLLHLGLGFGLNEVYIMSAHWIFVLPLAMTYLFKAMEKQGILLPCSLVTLLLSLYLYIWNFVIIFQEMT